MSERAVLKTIMEASELVPALRDALHPPARVLLLGTGAAPEENGWRLLANRSAAPLTRVAQLAAELGYYVETAPDYATIAGAAPELVIFDGTSSADFGLVRELRALSDLQEVAFLALISERASGEILEKLHEAGATAFLSADATPLEVASRLKTMVELHRARVEIVHLRGQLNRQSRVDDVTGVTTRRFFFQQAHRECARARRYGHPLSCLMVEINHYRMLCATFSDATGESVLRSVATIIGQWTRDSDIIARFSEAKFVILLPETDLNGATCAREKVQKALQEHAWHQEARVLPVSVSVGEAELTRRAFPRAGVELLTESDEMGESALSTREAMAGLLEDADAALYIARRGARVPEMFVPHTFASNDIPILAVPD